jgi:hypothetical protein
MMRTMRITHLRGSEPSSHRKVTNDEWRRISKFSVGLWTIESMTRYIFLISQLHWATRHRDSSRRICSKEVARCGGGPNRGTMRIATD